MFLIDLDHYKGINDKYGHEVGDKVLQAVASRMEQATRACGTVARYDGDEFVMLMTDIANHESAELKAERVFETITQVIGPSAGEVAVSCNIGIALCPNHGQSLNTLLKAADQAMYGVKQMGRKGIAITTTRVV